MVVVWNFDEMVSILPRILNLPRIVVSEQPNDGGNVVKVVVANEDDDHRRNREGLCGLSTKMSYCLIGVIVLLLVCATAVGLAFALTSDGNEDNEAVNTVIANTDPNISAPPTISTAPMDSGEDIISEPTAMPSIYLSTQTASPNSAPTTMTPNPTETTIDQQPTTTSSSPHATPVPMETNNSPAPTAKPVPSPTTSPTTTQTPLPSKLPTATPTTWSPTVLPTLSPTTSPPTRLPTTPPTAFPTRLPTASPTTRPPTGFPTRLPTSSPTTRPPTSPPTSTPTTSPPTKSPTALPTQVPTLPPTSPPTALATVGETCICYQYYQNYDFFGSPARSMNSMQILNFETELASLTVNFVPTSEQQGDNFQRRKRGRQRRHLFSRSENKKSSSLSLRGGGNEQQLLLRHLSVENYITNVNDGVEIFTATRFISQENIPPGSDPPSLDIYYSARYCVSDPSIVDPTEYVQQIHTNFVDWMVDEDNNDWLKDHLESNNALPSGNSLSVPTQSECP